MHKSIQCKLGCTCKLCLLAAYAEWTEESDDPEVMELVAEIIAEDYPTLDVVEE